VPANSQQNNVLKGIFSRTVSLSGAAFIVAIFSILSRIIGLVRDRMLAGAFGASESLDIYFAAFRIPDLVYQMLVVGALSASFIPLFSKIYNKEGEEDAWRMVNNILHILLVIFIACIACAWFLAPQLAVLVAPGMSEGAIKDIAQLMKYMFIAQAFLAVSMIYGSVLQSLRRFFVYAFAPIVYNVGIILGLIFIVPKMGLIGLAYGVIIGAFFHMALQIAGMMGTGYKWMPIFIPWDKNMRYLLSHTPPRMLGLLANQLMLMSMTVFASWIGVGAIAMTTFAYNLNFFPVGVIGVSFAIAAFPALSHAAQTDNEEEFSDILSATIKQVFFFLIPITVVTLLMRSQIVRAVVGAGAFDWDATIATAELLGLFALSFIPQSLVYVFARAFFAKEDTFTPLFVGFGTLATQLALTLVLVPVIGLPGLGIAFTVASFVQAGILWLIFRFYLARIDSGNLMKSLGRLLIAGLFAAVTLQLTKQIVGAYISLDTWWNIVAQFGIGTVVSFGMYFLSAWLMGAEEISAFFASLRKRILSKVRPSETVNSSPSS
jgi:putative peptidoglycan lipid II flippase